MNRINTMREGQARGAWKRVVICKADASKIKSIVNDLDNQIRDLGTQLGTSDEELWTLKHQKEARKFGLRVANDRTATAMADYYRLCSREFCDKVLAKLPRELRDLVYEFVLLPGPIYLSKLSPRHCQGGTLPQLGIEYRMANPTDISPNLRSPLGVDNIGMTMRKEMAEVWYHTTKFHFAAADVLLVNFLSTDHWGTGVDPCTHVRKIQISFEIKGVEQAGLLKVNLQQLCNLKAGAHVTIGIFDTISRARHYSRSVDIRKRSHTLLLFLKIGTPALRRLQQNGVTFELVLARADSGGPLGRFKNKEQWFSHEILDASTEEVAEWTDCPW